MSEAKMVLAVGLFLAAVGSCSALVGHEIGVLLETSTDTNGSDE